MAEADKLATGERILVTEHDALLVIDVQPTFMPGGGLPVPGGDKIIPMIRRTMRKFSWERRIATKDRHPRGHISLASSYIGRAVMSEVRAGSVEGLLGRENFLAVCKQPLAPHAKFTPEQLEGYLRRVGSQVLWPDHAIAGTAEAELHHGLDIGQIGTTAEAVFAYVLVKGTHPCEDSYSGFKGNAGTPTELADVLRDRGITRIFVCGLALDYCVRYTAEDGKAAGFEVVVIEDATRAVGFPKGSVEATRTSFREKGIRLVQADQLVAG